MIYRPPNSPLNSSESWLKRAKIMQLILNNSICIWPIKDQIIMSLSSFKVKKSDCLNLAIIWLVSAMIHDIYLKMITSS